jgi:hypothetical protein
LVCAKFSFAFLAAVFCLAATIPFSFAQSAVAVGSSSVRAHLEYSITVPDAATEVVFSAYAFPNTSAQAAEFNCSAAYSLSRDAYGNDVLSFRYTPVSGQAKTISVDSLVFVSYDPSNYSFEKATAGADYLQESKLVKVDAQSRSLARSIAQAARSREETLAALSLWVYGNIVYDANYTDSALDSATTLQVGRGTCDEKAHLLESFLRSLGIPARHVVGFAYSGKDWEPHAWVEAEVNGEWVPADPTFNEIFFLDASHLRFAVGRDQDDTKLSLKATGTSDLSSSVVVPKKNLSFASALPYSRFIELSASFPQGVRNASEVSSVNATVKNLLFRTVAVPVSLSLHSDFSTPSEREPILVIPAGSQAAVSWAVVYPFKVPGGYGYNYSCSVSAYGLEQRGYLLAAQAGAQSQSSPSVAVENLAAKKLADAVQLLFWLRNTGTAPISGAVLTLSASDSTFSRSVSYLGVGNSTRVEFLLPYLLAQNKSELEANLTVKLGSSEYRNALQIDLSEGPATAPALGSNLAAELYQVLLSPQFIAGALVALASALAFSVRRRRR